MAALQQQPVLQSALRSSNVQNQQTASIQQSGSPAPQLSAPSPSLPTDPNIDDIISRLRSVQSERPGRAVNLGEGEIRLNISLFFILLNSFKGGLF